MDLNLEDFWNIFHDGKITKIEGAVPGKLTLRINTGLAELFTKDTNGYGLRLSKTTDELHSRETGLKVHLNICTFFELSEVGEKPTSDLGAIEKSEPTILSLLENSSWVVLDCTIGRLALRYESAHVTFDSGEPLCIEALLAADRVYWGKS
jgi:hypothetical protein